jgi:DNA-binding response OmpR family regulator
MELKTKVLIVEDETIVALDIKRAILNLGFEVTNTATTFDEAINCVKKNTPDIILMDINLENSPDGITTAHEIKKTNDIPIIYLTAFCDDETINRAIQTNPVGYLLKPFKVDELKSTILLAIFKSKRNKTQTINKEYKSLGNNYYYDEKNQTLYYKDTPIKLSTRESSLLYILYKNKGKTVPFETIEHHLWEDNIVSNSTLRTLIYRLRSKLEYKLIETIPLNGCKLK